MEALCAGKNTDLFFPTRKEVAKAREAKKLCLGCPVRLQCLRFAVEHEEQGIWGGTTEGDREFMIITGIYHQIIQG